jgi:tricorn protease
MLGAVYVPGPTAGITAGDIITLDLRDVHGTKIFYQTLPIQNMVGANLPGEKSALHIFDVDKRLDSVIAVGLDHYSLSVDGKSALFKKDGAYWVKDTVSRANEHDDGKKLNFDAMHVRIDPTAEWTELFDNAWRLERDFFYSTAMNGVDWNAVRDSYRKLLPLAGSRADVNYLIGQMLGELSNSHTYVGGGDNGDPTTRVGTPALGVDFGLDEVSGRYKFATIYRGDNTRPDYRSPLTEPGINVKEGDILLAVNGTELRAPQTPYGLMVGIKPSETITLTVDSLDGKRRDVVVTPLESDLQVRENAWIVRNRETVDRLSSGRIAYIYLSDMGPLGMRQFIRQYYGQLDKQALIIDDRWNFGGYISQMLLERLRRVQSRLEVNRERSPNSRDNRFPPTPMICLTNHYSVSGGDMFPYYFKEYGLGKLVGTRTWGGVRALRGDWVMMDGGYITIPEWSDYGPTSQWVIENHGVDPDVEVENLPGELLAGHDKQLETAVALLLKDIAGKPIGLPSPPPLLPAYPADSEVPGPAH